MESASVCSSEMRSKTVGLDLLHIFVEQLPGGRSVAVPVAKGVIIADTLGEPATFHEIRMWPAGSWRQASATARLDNARSLASSWNASLQMSRARRAPMCGVTIKAAARASTLIHCNGWPMKTRVRSTM